MRVCSECGSRHIEYAKPAWFDANTHEQTSVDDEADILYTYCGSCDESRQGDWTTEKDAQEDLGKRPVSIDECDYEVEKEMDETFGLDGWGNDS